VREERPVRYEGGDIFLGERHRLFLDVVGESQLVWVDERDPSARFFWKRGWSNDALSRGGAAGGRAADDGGLGETSGAELETEEDEDGLPRLRPRSHDARAASREGPRQDRGGRFPQVTAKELAMRFQ